MHHPRYQHHTGGNGQHGVIRQGGRVEKRLPKTFAGKDQEKQGGCHGKNGDGIDKTVKPGAVQIRKRSPADADKAVRTLGKQHEKIAEKQPGNSGAHRIVLKGSHGGKILSGVCPYICFGKIPRNHDSTPRRSCQVARQKTCGSDSSAQAQAHATANFVEQSEKNIYIYLCNFIFILTDRDLYGIVCIQTDQH